ncbi:hypothetical protein GCM10023324_21810 [Streptomyces youssoufiensis]
MEEITSPVREPGAKSPTAPRGGNLPGRGGGGGARGGAPRRDRAAPRAWGAVTVGPQDHPDEWGRRPRVTVASAAFERRPPVPHRARVGPVGAGEAGRSRLYGGVVSASARAPV